MAIRGLRGSRVVQQKDPQGDARGFLRLESSATTTLAMLNGVVGSLYT